MIKDYQDIIEAICGKFNHAITQLDIVRWLENFDKADWKKALIVLNNFEFFSTNDIVKEFNNGLLQIRSQISIENKIYLIPLGKTGKSGSAMIYYLKKTPCFDNRKTKLEIIENKDFSSLPDSCNIVIVDDFSGTGNSIIEFYNSIKSNIPKNHVINALTVAFMRKAKSNLASHKIKLVGNERISCFASRGSVFGYLPRMKAIRNFCFEYGDKLYPEQAYREKKTKQHPLGYSNTQALLGFEHSIPNNTLPIMWADCKLVGQEKKWLPLFPRRGNLLIEKAKEFRQSQNYWASIIYKVGLGESVFSDETKYNKGTIQLISVMYLKKKQKNVLYICQMLGINLNEYDLIIEKGREKNLFDAEGKLTAQALQIYDEIQKKYRFQKRNIETDLMIDEDTLYIPKRFLGSS